MGFREKHAIPDLGVGVGLRRPTRPRAPAPSLDGLVRDHQRELLRRGRRSQRANLEALRAAYRVVPHGVSLSIGGTDPLDREYLARLRTLVRASRRRGAATISAGPASAASTLHDLLPLPYTRSTLEHVVERVKRVQGELEIPFALENASSYMEYRESTMPEHEFLAEVAEQADCGILLDVNNVFVSAYNHGFDADAYIDGIPADRVVQIHLAGHTDKGTLPARHPLGSRAGGGLGALPARGRVAADPVSTLVEWDEEIPAWEVLAKEAEVARSARRRGPRGPEGPPMDDQPLSTLQRFIADAIGMHAGDRRPDPTSSRGLASSIAPGARGLDAATCLEVYREQFWLRHLANLEEDFPTLRGSSGPAPFREIGIAVSRGASAAYVGPAAPRSEAAIASLAARPVERRTRSRSTPLSSTGPSWRRSTPPTRAPLDPSRSPRPPRMRGRRRESSFTPRFEGSSSRHPAHDLRDAVRRGEARDRPAAATTPSWSGAIGVLSPRRQRWSRSPSSCSGRSRAGRPSVHACEAVAGAHANDGADLSAKLGAWFQRWTAEGWISAVRI